MPFALISRRARVRESSWLRSKSSLSVWGRCNPLRAVATRGKKRVMLVFLCLALSKCAEIDNKIVSKILAKLNRSQRRPSNREVTLGAD